MKVKSCSPLCAQAFSLLGDIKKSDEKVSKSRELKGKDSANQFPPNNTSFPRIICVSGRFKLTIMDLIDQVGKSLPSTKLAKIQCVADAGSC